MQVRSWTSPHHRDLCQRHQQRRPEDGLRDGQAKLWGPGCYQGPVDGKGYDSCRCQEVTESLCSPFPQHYLPKTPQHDR
jgi:hypothetical protein